MVLKIDEEQILDYSGEVSLPSVKEIVLRDLALEEMDEDVAKELISLEVLSLSHNNFTALKHFQNFNNLLELNMNFNNLKSLNGLNCPLLRKLYAVNNKISDISQLKKMPQLQTLALFGNALSDFDATISILKLSLKSLRTLDLDGNPLSQSTSNYKYHVLNALPKLTTLDGDTVTALDREMTEDLAASQKTSRNNFATARPSTAPAFRGANSASSDGQPTLDDLRKHMPRGEVNLFRSHFLNNNPILLEYLATDALNQDGGGTTSAESSQDLVTKLGQDFAEKESSKFVEKIRTGKSSTNKSTEPASSAPPSLTRRESSNNIVDPSDPAATIRKLLKMVQILTDERDTLVRENEAGTSSTISELRRENEMLRIENNNIPILQAEVKSLRSSLKKPVTLQGNNNKSNEAELQDQLDRSNLVISKLKSKVSRLERSKESVPEEPSSILNTKELFDDSAEIDEELTELIMRNQVALQQCRVSMRKTKRELKLNRAFEATSSSARPHTSAGHGDGDFRFQKSDKRQEPGATDVLFIH